MSMWYYKKRIQKAMELQENNGEGGNMEVATPVVEEVEKPIENVAEKKKRTTKKSK